MGAGAEDKGIICIVWDVGGNYCVGAQDEMCFFDIVCWSSDRNDFSWLGCWILLWFFFQLRVYETMKGKGTISYTKRECFKVEFTFFYEPVNIFLSVSSTFSQEALSILADDWKFCEQHNSYWQDSKISSLDFLSKRLNLYIQRSIKLARFNFFMQTASIDTQTHKKFGVNETKNKLDLSDQAPCWGGMIFTLLI